MTTVVITTQPTRHHGVRPGPGHDYREWASGICGCLSDLRTCSYTCCCLCCMMGDTAERLGDCYVMPYLVPAATMGMRIRIRSMGGIKGTICNDCVMSTCCYPCAVCQMSRELDTMGVL
ncbi:hypothetical protein ScPMuIL_012254 [Solemya velum]